VRRKMGDIAGAQQDLQEAIRLGQKPKRVSAGKIAGFDEKRIHLR